jgi:hypothetical protein
MSLSLIEHARRIENALRDDLRAAMVREFTATRN